MSQDVLSSQRLLHSGAMKKKSTTPDTTIKCKKIGNYVLSSTIGTGTFSKVKLGIHLATQQRVAIKILDRSKIKDESDLKRINREISILKTLRHPNIAQLYETITSERHFYIVMEYIEGKDLFQYIYSKNYLDEVKASALFRQLISTLEYIHTLGIVHRDIKPENILLDKSKTSIKLVDFGLSNSYRHGELLRTACGSPCYASPEMISGKEYNGLYSDLWSCGVVLYCMLTGKLPFDDEDIKQLYRKIQNARYKMPEYLSDIAKDFLSRILRTNPEKRIKLEEIKRHPFYTIGEAKCPPLQKGILIGIEDIPVDYELVLEIKRKYYPDKPKITEEFICDNITSNNHNNLTAIYYLLQKQKNELLKKGRNDANVFKCKTSTSNTLNSSTNYHLKTVDRKKCDMFNLSTIKRISFDSNTMTPNSNQGNIKKIDSTIHNNSNTTNNNNRFNVVVINTFVGEPTHPKKNNNNITVNLDSNNKLNASTSFTNNVLTTKINLNEMISNQITKQRGISRNMFNVSELKRNKTVSSTTHNNFSVNLNNTINAYKRKSAKSKEITKPKFIFSSPSNSQDDIIDKPIKAKPIIKRNVNNILHIMNKTPSKPRQHSQNNNKYINKYFMKKIFENESFLNSNGGERQDRHHNVINNNSFNLNMTCYYNNNRNTKTPQEGIKRPLKTSKIKKSLVTNIIKSNNTSANHYSSNNNSNNTTNKSSYVQKMKIPNTKKSNIMHINAHNAINQILRKNFSLSLNKSKEKTQNQSISKEKKIVSLKSNSLNKKKNTIITNTSIIHYNNNANKIPINNSNKAKIGFGTFNLANAIKKTFSKEKMKKTLSNKKNQPIIGRNNATISNSKNTSKPKTVKSSSKGKSSVDKTTKTKKNFIHIKI